MPEHAVGFGAASRKDATLPPSKIDVGLQMCSKEHHAHSEAPRRSAEFSRGDP
jgi:hypothetical protein